MPPGRALAGPRPAAWGNCRLSPREKTRALVDFADEAMAALRHHVSRSTDFRSARNLYPRVVLDPSAESRFAQSLPVFAEHYDEVVLMAMPWLDGTELPAGEWLADLADAVEGQLGGFEGVIFELQARDWREGGDWVEGTTLRRWMRQLMRRGALNLAYYPDDFLRDRPPLGPTFEGISLNAFPHRK
ncbi:MAG: poly-beta-1,6-N-acetyl-D-glucosamine N-deacetylase PgaB [Arhodomonas sp.]|nr:poly-beta-1,6-N-acetyl-D-glucosamine N-deacetylase PgaB [Arhodomonas sp.]